MKLKRKSSLPHSSAKKGTSQATSLQSHLTHCLRLPLDCWLSIAEFDGLDLDQWFCLNLVCKDLNKATSSAVWISILQPTFEHYVFREQLMSFTDARYLAFQCIESDHMATKLSAFKSLTSLKFDECLSNSGLCLLPKNAPLLKVLEVSNCPRIDAKGMRSVALLTNLESLGLIECENITNAGLLQLSTLTRLTSLNLMKSRVSDDAIQVVSHFPALESLNISHNLIDCQGLSVLLNLSFLTKLEFEHIVVPSEGSVTVLSQLTCLQSLKLRDTGHWLTDSANLSTLQNLTTFACTQHFRNTTPFVYHFTKLESLHFDGGFQFDQLVYLRRLRVLHLTNCKIGDTDMSYVAEIKQLEDLRLSKCVGVTNSGMSFLLCLSALRVLEMKDLHEVTDFSAVSTLTKLHILSLQSAGQQDRDMQALSNLTRLTYLSLAGSKHLTDLGLQYLPSQLEGLFIQYCPNISDASIPKIMSLSLLNYLNVSGCSFSRPVLQKIKQAMMRFDAWVSIPDEVDRASHTRVVSREEYATHVEETMELSYINQEARKYLLLSCLPVPLSSSSATSSVSSSAAPLRSKSLADILAGDWNSMFPSASTMLTNEYDELIANEMFIQGFVQKEKNAREEEAMHNTTFQLMGFEGGDSDEDGENTSSDEENEIVQDEDDEEEEDEASFAADKEEKSATDGMRGKEQPLQTGGVHEEKTSHVHKAIEEKNKTQSAGEEEEENKSQDDEVGEETTDDDEEEGKTRSRRTLRLIDVGESAESYLARTSAPHYVDQGRLQAFCTKMQAPDLNDYKRETLVDDYMAECERLDFPVNSAQQSDTSDDSDARNEQ